MKNKNPKEFKSGDIAYWCGKNGNRYEVKCGVVCEVFGKASSSVITLYPIVPRERRLVNGIPIKEFKSDARYRKLPRGWTYDTKLFDITYEHLTEEEMEFTFDIRNKESLKCGLQKGYLVPSFEIFHGYIKDEITKDGYKIIKCSDYSQDDMLCNVITTDKLYFTYNEALHEVLDNVKELRRQAEMSEYDWAVEQIDKKLEKLKSNNSFPDDVIQKYKTILVSIDNIENIEDIRVQKSYMLQHTTLKPHYKFEFKYFGKDRWYIAAIRAKENEKLMKGSGI